jgi:hypothetical protein
MQEKRQHAPSSEIIVPDISGMKQFLSLSSSSHFSFYTLLLMFKWSFIPAYLVCYITSGKRTDEIQMEYLPKSDTVCMF